MKQSAMQQSLGVTAAMMVEHINRQGSGDIRVSVEPGISTASTDGNLIRLPVVPDDKRFIALAYLGHEASHARVTDMSAFRAFAKRSPLHKAVLNIIEDIRIERSIIRVYPGLRGLLAQLVAHLVQQGSMGHEEEVDGQPHPVVVFVNWMLHTRRAWVLRQSALDESARKDDTLARSVLGDDIIDRAEKTLEALPTMGLDFQATAESVAVAEQIIDLIREAEETHNDRSGAEQDQPDAGADEGSDSGGSSDSEEEDAPEKAGGQGQRNPSKSEEPWANEPLPDTDLGDLLENDGHLEAGPGRGRSSAGQTFSFASRSRLVAYPEHMRQEIAQEASALAGGIRRSLRALLEGQDRNRRDPRRQGRLDTRSLASVMTGNRRAFYREEFARAQSSAVHILLDVSGSMMAVESARGYSLMRESLIATHAMMEALEPLSKVRSAVSVFPNESQNEVWCPVPFSETFSGVKRKQASSLYPAGGGTSTPMFQSLRAVAGNLLAQPEERKIAIVVTDGDPDFTGETPSKVVDDVRNCGVSVFGVGLGVDLSNVFGEQYVSVEKLEALSGELKKAARNLLR